MLSWKQKSKNLKERHFFYLPHKDLPTHTFPTLFGCYRQQSFSFRKMYIWIVPVSSVRSKKRFIQPYWYRRVMSFECFFWCITLITYLHIYNFPIKCVFKSDLFPFMNNYFCLICRFGGGFFAIRNVILGVTSGFATEFELQDVSYESWLRLL